MYIDLLKKNYPINNMGIDHWRGETDSAVL